jgi:hypothetical protein
VCMPERLENPEYPSLDVGQVCDYSLDCGDDTGLVCVCIPGAICEVGSEGRNGPTCQRLCDPTEVRNECPSLGDLRPECTDLGTGRGFCDPTTVSLEP